MNPSCNYQTVALFYRVKGKAMGYGTTLSIYRAINYERLMPELFRRKNDGKAYQMRKYTIYRGILVIQKTNHLTKSCMFSAYQYDWKAKKKHCIQAEFTYREIVLAIDKYLDVYQPQLVFNKDCKAKGLVTKTKPCDNFTCQNIANCRGMLRVRILHNTKKYYWVCREHFILRKDGELQMSDAFPSPFFPDIERQKWEERRKNSFHYLTNEDGSAILCPE